MGEECDTQAHGEASRSEKIVVDPGYVVDPVHYRAPKSTTKPESTTEEVILPNR